MDNKGFYRTSDCSNDDVWTLIKAVKDGNPEEFAATDQGPALRWIARAKHPSQVARAAKLKDARDGISKLAVVPVGSTLSICQRKAQILLLPVGEVLAKMQWGAEVVDLNYSALERLSVTKAMLDQELASIREKKRFL